MVRNPSRHRLQARAQSLTRNAFHPAIAPVLKARTLTLAIGCALAGLGSVAVLTPGLALAAETQASVAVREYDIAAGRLGDVLAEFAATAGVPLSFDPRLLAGHDSDGLQGRYTVGEGFSRLLAGSGYEVVALEGGSYALREAPISASERDVELPMLMVEATGMASGITEGTGSYTTGSTSAATGLNLSLRETPQSVTVITSQQIRDRGFTNVLDALANSPGIYKVNDFTRPDFFSRGFSISNFTVDGAPMQPIWGGSSGHQQTSTVAYDSISIVRGANGLLTGTGDPSASINMTRKRATRDFQSHVQASAGSWETYGLEADVSGPFNADGSVRGRLALGGTDGDHFIDNKSLSTKTLFATLEADATQDTTLRAGLHLEHPRYTGTAAMSRVPLFYSDGSFIDPPRSWGDVPRAYWQKQDARTAFLGLEHDFANGWQIDAVLNHTTHRRENARILIPWSANNYPNSDGSWPMMSTGMPAPFKDRQWSYDVDAQGPLRLFGREHELMVGVSGWKRERRVYQEELSDYTLPDGFLDADLWSIGDYAFFPEQRILPFAATRAHTEQHGGLLAARWNLADSVKLITGARLTSWKTRTDNYDAESGEYLGTTGDYEVRNELTPYVGATWDFHPQLTAYTSYADVFTPQNYYDRNDELLEPVVGKSYEVGVKGEFFDRRLNTSAALFRVQRDNLAIPDPDFPDGYETPAGNSPHISAGKGNRSRGIDLEVAGALTDRWNISGGYTYASLTDGDGNRLSSNDSPEHIFRLFTAYRFGSDHQGLTVGGGVNWHSSLERDFQRPTGDFQDNGSPVTSTHTFRQSGVALANAMLRYDINSNLSASLNVDNIFDETYFSGLGAWSPMGVYGAPRSFRASVRYDF